MNNPFDFLEKFKKIHNTSATASTDQRNLSVMLSPSLSNYYNIDVSIVDKSLKPVNPAEVMTAGAIGRLARSLAKIEGSDFAPDPWGGMGNTYRYCTADYPYLADMLADCIPHIVDKKGNPIPIIESRHTVKADITELPDSETKLSTFSIYFLAGGHIIQNFLSDDLVLTTEGIAAVNPVGENFSQLHNFSSPFTPQTIDTVLSILLSSTENIELYSDSRQVRKSVNPAVAVPTLVFKKVDSDNSLYLQLSMKVGNLPTDVTDNFTITKAVSSTDSEIAFRDVEANSPEIWAERLNDVLRNNAGSKTAFKTIYNEDLLYIIPAEIASTFLFKGLPQLLQDFDLLGTEKLKSYKITPAKPKLKIALSSGIDFLEGSASVEIGDQKMTLNDLLSQYTKNRYVTLKDGNRAILDSSYMKRLQRIFRRSGSKKDNRVTVSFFDLPEVAELLDTGNLKNKVFKRSRDFYEGFNSLKNKRLSNPGLKAKLRTYQNDGVKWLRYLYENGFGGCLADDMGLGKTVQTIALINMKLKDAKTPVLIVMPRSLLFNWEQEFSKFAPQINVNTYYGTARDFERSMEAQVVLTTYAMVRNDIDKFTSIDFDTVILDESQNIKNVDAMTTKAIWLLKAAHRFALSGTPIENNLTELYSLFRFLNPTMFGSLNEFTERYAAPIQREGDEDSANALRKRIFPFLLRRMKKDVLTDLPDRMDQTLKVEMSPAQARLYEERRQIYAGEIEGMLKTTEPAKLGLRIIAALTELRQIASIPEEKSEVPISSPKIELLAEKIVEAVENGHKVAVFFNFLAGIELTATRLGNAGIGYEIMTGATSNRKSVVERFQNDPDCKVILMTVKTGGVGLNLVAADTVFVVEPWWNKAAEEQAINRLHRIGQKNAVNCYYMITENTIEEKIRQLQEKKTALVDAVISSDTVSKQLSADDINFLLS